MNEEWCVTYHYPVGKLVLEASTISENELHFQIRLPDGTLALPSITSNHPCEGPTPYGKSLGTGLYNEIYPKYDSEKKGVAVVWLSDYHWPSSVDPDLDPRWRTTEDCSLKLPPNPVTVVITAVDHDLRIEVPVAVTVNGYIIVQDSL